MLEVNTTIIDFEFGFNMFRLPEVWNFLINPTLDPQDSRTTEEQQGSLWRRTT
jgi:hypothetical protein